MDGSMFDGLILAVLVIGALIGAALVGVFWALFWLASHIVVRWV